MNQPKKVPGKLKIPDVFLSKPKETPKIQKKETKKQIEEIKIDQPKPNDEQQNKEEVKPKEETKTKEELKPKEETKQEEEIRKPSVEIKKSYTTKEVSTNKETPISKPLPKVEEKELKSQKTFVEEGRRTVVLESTNFLNEMFIEPTTYGQFLRDEQNKGVKHPYRETFCEGFFIASFPQKDGKVIENSQSFPAPCKHAECSKLPSMKPEIIFRYPLKDTKTLELNNLAATICFPTGIKVCYNESGPGFIKDYVTSITNQK